VWRYDDGLGGLPVADLIVLAQRDTKSGGVVLSVAFPRPDIYLSIPLMHFTIHPCCLPPSLLSRRQWRWAILHHKPVATILLCRFNCWHKLAENQNQSGFHVVSDPTRKSLDLEL